MNNSGRDHFTDQLFALILFFLEIMEIEKIALGLVALGNLLRKCFHFNK
jgi:hypothetical protein